MYATIAFVILVIVGFVVLKLTEKQIDRVIDEAFDGFDNYDNLNG